MSKPRDEIEAIYPLSPMQQGMLFHSLYAPETGMYFEQLSCTLRGPLHSEAFQEAWQQVVNRHPILRTLFVWERRGDPLQIVRKGVRLPWRLYDWRGLSPSEQQERLVALLQTDRAQGFDLAKAPLMRLTLVQLAEESYQFVWSSHHILMDGWCQSILLEEVLRFYEAAQQRVTLALPPPRPYRDYISWLQKQDMGEAEAFWRETLRGFAVPTPLPLSLPLETGTPHEGRYEHQHLLVAAETTAALRTLARQHQLTLNSFAQAAWALLLSRYSGERDVVFGVLVSGRPPDLAGSENMIGLFINTLPLRVQVDPEAPLLAWLKQVQAQQAALQQYEYTPLVRIQGWSEVHKGSALFETILSFNNFGGQGGDGAQGGTGSVAVENVNSFERTNYPLALLMTPAREMMVELSYSTARYQREAVERLLHHFQMLLESMVAHPEQRVGDLPLLTEAEQNQVLYQWNESRAPFPSEACFHTLFEQQAAQTPDALAVVLGDQQLTYKALDQRANQLAHHLRGLGVGPETLVGICTERSVDTVVAILGVFKAGGAYLPMDPAYPSDRLEFMAQDARLGVLITQERLLETLPPHQARVVCVDRDGAEIGRHPTSAPTVAVTPQNLAYVIYTSGSTGRPKGVMLAHRGLCNLSEAQVKSFGLRAENHTLQFSSLSFDASIFEIVMALRVGATLYLGSAEMLMPGPALLRLIQGQQITNVTLPPSVLATLPDEELPDLHTIVVAGEACPAALVARWAAGRRFFNAYGPTEATVWSTYFECRDGSQKPPIGQPIQNIQAYILDATQRPVPVGVAGELHIGGVGLARGYLNRPELTAEKFIPDPFGPQEGARLYKTGDLARYQPDGNIEFLGRIDHQVKIRGFRIELGEIEAVLGQHPAVRETIVLARQRRTQQATADSELVAYVVPHTFQTPPSIPDLRQHLRAKLPEHMVPANFVLLEALPLTPNAKVDRRALPEPDHVKATTAYVAPRTEMESQVAALWAEVLGVPQVGIHDDFFELGGHSLLVTQLMFRVREAFGVELPLNSLFAEPTVEGLAATIERFQREGAAAAFAAQGAVDLDAEVMLDPSIPEVRAPGRVEFPAEKILLTGATGFLGAFLLADLLTMTQADIYCLVRAPSEEEGRQRLQESLTKYKLWDAQVADRIIPVVGDLAKPRLGLTPQAFDQLAEEIDAIYHSGATVNFVQPYRALKSANVLGTQEVLRLAGRSRLKAVHHISSLSVFSPASYGHLDLIRERDPLEHHAGLEVGYVQTKWVAEKMVMLAQARGMPISIYRPGRITGHTQTGAASTDDFIYRMIKGCIQMGSVPDAEAPIDMVPVDYVSQAIVHISKQKEMLGQAFHLTNPYPISLAHLVKWMRSFGYPLKMVSFPKWRQQIMDVTQGSTENALYPLLAMFSTGTAAPVAAAAQHAKAQNSSRRGPHFHCQNTISGLMGTDITCPPVDTELLDTYFSYFVQHGFLDAPEQGASGWNRKIKSILTRIQGKRG